MGHKPQRARAGDVLTFPLIAVMVVVVALAGCASSGKLPGAAGASSAAQKPWSQLKSLANPRDYVGPTTATVADANIIPITKDPKPVLPATVKDHQGTAVTVRSTDRILALEHAQRQLWVAELAKINRRLNDRNKP